LAGNDFLLGNIGNDMLDGGTGADTMMVAQALTYMWWIT